MTGYYEGTDFLTPEMEEWIARFRVKWEARDRASEDASVARKSVAVNAERTRYVVTTVRVDTKTGEQCERCGVDLWTRDGVGRYEAVAFLESGPVLQRHGYPACG